MARQKKIPLPKLKPVRCPKCKAQDGFIYVRIRGEQFPRLQRCNHKELPVYTDRRLEAAGETE